MNCRYICGYAVHSPTNALFINLVKSSKFTLKYTIISLLHVSVFNDHHQGALSVPDWSHIYVKTLGKITSHSVLHTAHAATSPNIYNDVILPSVLT